MATGIENALLTDWVQEIILTVVLGLLALFFRRALWRLLARIYQRIANPAISVRIMVVRSFRPFDPEPISHSIIERIRSEVPEAQVTDKFKESVDVVIAGYGKFHTRVEQVGSPEDEVKEEMATVPLETRIVMESDVPIRMGARDLPEITEFGLFADRILRCVAAAVSPNPPYPLEDYVILDIPRFHPIPENASALDEKDSTLNGVRVRAGPKDLEITTPIVLLGKAVRKYRFA